MIHRTQERVYRKHPPKAAGYLSGAGRWRGLVSTTEQSEVFFVHPDELHQGLDAEVGELPLSSGVARRNTTAMTPSSPTP